MSEKRSVEFLTEEEYEKMMENVKAFDDDFVDDEDIEEERILECQKKS